MKELFKTVKNVEKVECSECGFKAHFLEPHLKEAHGLTPDDYESEVMSEPAKAYLKNLEAQSRNEQIDFDIKKTFGTEINDSVKTVKGFKSPHANTPETDADYFFRQRPLAVVLYASMKANERVLLTGPTGSGKSTIIEQVAARLNKPFYRVNLDNDITRSDFIGKDELKGDETRFLYGILPKAMIEGAWLLVDEWDCANPGVAMVLQAVLEGKPLTITETGEVIYPHEDFRIFATSNTLGQGDDTGLYNGTQPQNFAQLDRFTLVEVIDYPKVAEEKKILAKKTGINDSEILDKFLKVGNLVRDAFLKEEIMTTMSTRTMVNIANKLKDFGDVKMAYELAYLNKLSKDDRTFCAEIIQRVWAV